MSDSVKHMTGYKETTLAWIPDDFPFEAVVRNTRTITGITPPNQLKVPAILAQLFEKI